MYVLKVLRGLLYSLPHEHHNYGTWKDQKWDWVSHLWNRLAMWFLGVQCLRSRRPWLMWFDAQLIAVDILPGDVRIQRRHGDNGDRSLDSGQSPGGPSFAVQWRVLPEVQRRRLGRSATGAGRSVDILPTGTIVSRGCVLWDDEMVPLLKYSSLRRAESVMNHVQFVLVNKNEQ